MIFLIINSSWFKRIFIMNVGLLWIKCKFWRFNLSCVNVFLLVFLTWEYASCLGVSWKSYGLVPPGIALIPCSWPNRSLFLHLARRFWNQTYSFWNRNRIKNEMIFVKTMYEKILRKNVSIEKARRAPLNKG